MQVQWKNLQNSIFTESSLPVTFLKQEKLPAKVRDFVIKGQSFCLRKSKLHLRAMTPIFLCRMPGNKDKHNGFQFTRIHLSVFATGIPGISHIAILAAGKRHHLVVDRCINCILYVVESNTSIIAAGICFVQLRLHYVIRAKKSKSILGIGVIVNLGVLGLFKYADFMVANFNLVTTSQVEELGLILPLAISFYTFQQISFLRDAYHDKLVDCDFKRYLLFVTFFPQLIAGPIVMQGDTIPQFKLSVFNSRAVLNFLAGTTLFLIGLFKKIVLADGIAPTANAVFALADQGQTIPFEAAWFGAFAYTFQIYFDFSGYCDMALGLALMFGIRLPINFNSPYRSLSIVEFWRRWHITLSRFLRDYLYIPLGGNRSGFMGAKGNLAITMMLGGLWHGAGWNFIIWGGLHGAYLMINHAWNWAGISAAINRQPGVFIYKILCWLVTMFAVVIAWVFFRAQTFDGALNMLIAMTGFGTDLQLQDWRSIVPSPELLPTFLVVMLFIVVGLPNSMEFMKPYKPVLNSMREIGIPLLEILKFTWRPSFGWSAAICLVGSASIIQIYRLNGLTEFIYFNF